MTPADLHAFTLAGMLAAERRWARTRATLFPELARVAYIPALMPDTIELPTLDTFNRRETG